MIQITPTPEQLDRLDEAVFKHNEGKTAQIPGNPGMSRWVEIAVTGRLSEYYTLWHITTGRNGGQTRYVKNVCKDIEDLISFIEECNFPYRIDVVPSPTVINGYKSTVNGVPTMPIGKYRGALLEDIFKTDPNYILWFAKNFGKDKNGEYTRRLSEKDEALIQQANLLVELFWKQKTEINRETCKSEYIGALKQRMQHAGTVLFCKNLPQYKSEDPITYKVDLVDDNGNLFYVYIKEWMEKGARLEFTGTVTNHKEVVGKKKTYFNRIKY